MLSFVGSGNFVSIQLSLLHASKKPWEISDDLVEVFNREESMICNGQVELCASCG